MVAKKFLKFFKTATSRGPAFIKASDLFMDEETLVLKGS